MPERAPGPSVRLKLTLSYAVFVVLVGIAVFALGFLVLRFVPEGNLSSDSGEFTPARRDLLAAFVRYAWFSARWWDPSPPRPAPTPTRRGSASRSRGLPASPRSTRCSRARG